MNALAVAHLVQGLQRLIGQADLAGPEAAMIGFEQLGSAAVVSGEPDFAVHLVDCFVPGAPAAGSAGTAASAGAAGAAAGGRAASLARSSRSRPAPLRHRMR